MTETKEELREVRKQMLPTATAFSPRDSQSELCSPLGLPKEFFLLLRQYEEEMLDAFLQDDDYFPELLHSQDLRNERSKIESCKSCMRCCPQSWVRRI